MKKFFIALSVLAALMLGVAPAQALVGMPDDVPGANAVTPFLAAKSLTGLNTVVLFYDVKGTWTGTPTAPNADKFHYTVYDKDSATVFDDDLPGTAWDLVSADAITILGLMSPTAKAALLVDIDGDGTTDHYAGYIYWDADNDDNDTVGQTLFLDLNNGVAAGSNIMMKEAGQALVPLAFRDAMFNQDGTSEDVNMEQFSPNGLNAAVDLQVGLAAPTDAANFLMYPRFYILGSGDATWWMFWNSTDGLPGTLHLDWYDTEEHTASSNITIDDEWEIINVEPLLPTGLWPAATFPKEGFLNLTWATNSAALRGLETFGWSYLQATSGTSTTNNWTVLTNLVRDVD